MKQFQHIGKAQVPRSMFNLSYDKKFTCDMGQLIPVMCDEVVPGDIFDISNRMLVRMQPMVAPIMHEINAYTHYFFVPYRLLWDEWEEFITGGVDGPQDPDVSPVLERIQFADANGYIKNSLWDYLGFPIGVSPNTDHRPLAFPVQAYKKIWNEYYRDQTLQAELTENGTVGSPGVYYRNWEKDYFTSSLPWQQRGVAPALPITGLTNAVFSGLDIVNGVGDVAVQVKSTPIGDAKIYANNGDARNSLTDFMNSNVVDFGDAATFNVADLRLAFQVQRWLERNARAGARYTEFLNAHFGVHPRDDRLQRPEYIGGSKTPLIISEVLKTSEDGTDPQGNLAGHGITADMRRIGKYKVQEYGLIMGIMSIMPRAVYQQGIDRQWLRRTKYDFYFPEFANLSEQAIERAEIFTSAVEAENETIFGYQGRYDEMRVKKSMVCAEMRDTLDYWHLSRQFSAAPELNSTFIAMSATSPRKDIFAVTTDPGFIVDYANIIKAVRPMPIMSQPGLIDH